MSTSPRPSNLQEEIHKQRPFDLAEQEAYLNLVRTYHLLSCEYERVQRGHGITQSLYNVLTILDSAGREGLRSQTIAEHMVARDPDVTRLVDRLVHLGLAERERCEQDRRVIHVRITSVGATKVRQMRPAIKKLYKKLLGHMSDQDLSALSQLLFEARQGDL